MKEYSRIFNLGNTKYLYSAKLDAKDGTSIKSLSKRTIHNDLKKPVWTPIITKTKYGENAFTYEYLKDREVVFADNLLKESTFNVSKQLNGNHYNDIYIGNIKNKKINPASKNKHDLSLLRKVLGMIKKF